MASLRRPSQYYPSNNDKPQVTGRLPSRPPEAGRPRQQFPGQSSNMAKMADARKSRVEDRMKSRRMSMRYAEPDFGVLAAGASGPNFLSADPYQFTLDVAPPLEQDEDDAYAVNPPSQSVIPGARPGSVYDESPRSYAERRLEAEDAQGGNVQDEQIGRRTAAPADEWDFSALAKGDVDVNTFVRKALMGADEDEKKRFIAALRRHRDANAKDLQKNVFKHYAEFVNISKEISTLENDMLELKELLNEWKTVPQLMGMDDTLAPTLDKDGNVHHHNRGRRNSPLDLQAMYRAQITNLWSTVEGSQKYLNLASGRRLIFETHSFIELNAATYKAKQNVSLFLLTDLLLVAGRRRLKASPGALSNDPDYERGRMVAERCWVLTDLVVIDLKDSGELTNALKIKRGKEVCVYRASRPEDKKALLGAFRQVSNDLAEKKRKENEAEQERRRTHWQGGDGGSRLTMAMSMWGGGMGDGQRPITTIGTSLTDSKDLLWIDEYGDDLTMAIATQDWDEGVKLVERGKDLLRTVSNNEEATELLTFKLDTLRPNLVTQIARDLSSPKIRKQSASRLIALLTRLGSTDLARDTFLQARHDLMVKLIRAIKHEGDISLYVSELAVVCFTILRHTSDWYMNAFKENGMASGFVTWAKVQIEYFGEVFRRQVYAPTIEQSVIDECHKVTISASRKLLRDAGLDFTFLLSTATSRNPEPALTGFMPTPVSALPASSPEQQTGFAALMAGRPGQLKVDNFAYKNLNTAISPSPITPSDAITSANSDVSLSHGNTQPLSISRRPRPDRPDVRNISGASGTSGNASPPRPPPRSDRRSRPPPNRADNML